LVSCLSKPSGPTISSVVLPANNSSNADSSFVGSAMRSPIFAENATYTKCFIPSRSSAAALLQFRQELVDLVAFFQGCDSILHILGRKLDFSLAERLAVAHFILHAIEPGHLRSTIDCHTSLGGFAHGAGST